jgi:hypothetical protein
MTTPVMAIDPGKNGGIAFFNDGKIEVFDMPSTVRDMLDFFTDRVIPETIVVMEEVGGYIGRPMPGSRMFSFGRQFGNLEACIMATGCRLELVKPQKWQKGLSLGTSKGMSSHGEWKNKLKAEAQRLYPNIKVNLKNADAILILEYARKMHVV